MVTRQRAQVVQATPDPVDVKSLAQLSWRHMYQKAIALWHALSTAEKISWEGAATPKHMTGFAWFMSQCLKPNPGLYLPLQGGAMQGDIDMAKHLITRLPTPTDSQHPATKGYVDALTKVIWIDAPPTAMTDFNRTVSSDWTDLDLTALTSPEAKLAILLLRMRADTLGVDDSVFKIRKNGTTPSTSPSLVLDAAGTTTGVFHFQFAIIGLDSGQVMEHAIIVGPGGWQVDSIINVLGYIE